MEGGRKRNILFRMAERGVYLEENGMNSGRRRKIKGMREDSHNEVKFQKRLQ